MSNRIPIFCATDENYAPFASLMMKSVLMHTESFIDFYIMDGGICDKTKKLIDKDLKKYPNKELHYIDMGKYDLSQFPNLAYYSLNTFSRYFIPDITPQLSKIIYLDVDIIVTDDIAGLYCQELNGCAIAAMPESKYFCNNSQNRVRQIVWPKYHKDSHYFNAGVLLLDIQKLIQMDFTQKAVDLTVALYHKLGCPDQDVLNILFENNYKELTYDFNFMVYYENNLKKRFPDIQSIKPSVIHYAVFKPWKEYSPFFEEFNAVLQTSVFCKRVMRQFRSQKTSKYYLFGCIPLFEKAKIKNI